MKLRLSRFVGVLSPSHSSQLNILGHRLAADYQLLACVFLPIHSFSAVRAGGN